jgi:hypothetical protein
MAADNPAAPAPTTTTSADVSSLSSELSTAETVSTVAVSTAAVVASVEELFVPVLEQPASSVIANSKETTFFHVFFMYVSSLEFLLLYLKACAWNRVKLFVEKISFFC